MEIRDIFDQTLTELGLDLTDDTEDDFLTSTVEEPEAQPLEEGAGESEESDAEEGSEDSGEGSEPTEVLTIDLSESALLRLPDGTEVPAKDAILFQKDYTKKTQQLAEERKVLESEKNEFEVARREVEDTFVQMRDWYEARVANRSSWIHEIAAEADDPTATLARAIYELAQAGALDPDFVEAFGLEAGEFKERVAESTRNQEVTELRLRLEARERADAEQAQIRRQAAEYQSQWEQIKANHGLAFGSAQDEAAAKKELYDFATANNVLRSLVDAYDLMIVRTGKPAPGTAPADPEVVAKKRASRAVTPKSVAAGSSPKARPSTVRSAAVESLEEFLTRA